MKKTAIIMAALVAGIPVLAQNVNQTVNVTNDYKGNVGGYEKKNVDMNVPDTLLVFDYKFDYSVFDSPYKGAYEFSPYTVRFSQEPRNEYFNKLYLRFGAGYNFHPELEFDSDFQVKENLALSVFGNASGYLGNYRSLDTGLAVVPGQMYAGFDFDDNVGLAGKLSLRSSTLGFELGHDGIFAADMNLGSAFNSAYGKVRYTSGDANGSFFFYDLGASYRFGHDGVYYAPYLKPSLNEHDIALYGTLGPVLDQKYRFLADFYLEQEICGGMASCNATLFKVTPRFEFELGPVHLSAGAKLDFNSQNKMAVAPDVRAKASFFRDYLNVRASLTGDSELNSIYSMKRRNHFFVADNLMASDGLGPVRISRERLKAEAGLSSQFRHFHYDLAMGWSLRQNQLMDSYFFKYEGRPEDCFALASFQQLHADASLGWLSERLQVDAQASVRHLFKYSYQTVKFFAPSLFSGSVKAEYNWSRRIYAGARLSGCTRRSAVLHSDREDDGVSVPETATGAVRLPGWVDLGLSGRYVLSSRWTLWLDSANLLFQPVRKDITHVQAAPAVTVGAIFTL